MDWPGFISSVGFPIAVAVYLLVYFRRTMDDLTKVIARTNAIIEKMCDKLEVK